MTPEQHVTEWSPEDENPVATPPVSEPEKPRRSPFRTHRGHVAGSMLINDILYDYSQLPDPLREWMEKRSGELAGKLGVSLEAFQGDKYVADTAANRAALAKTPEANRPELARAAEVEKLPQYIEELYDRVLAECLVACDYPGVDFEREPQLKKDLAMEVKAKLVAQIGRSTRFGLSQQTFFPQRAA